MKNLFDNKVGPSNSQEENEIANQSKESTLQIAIAQPTEISLTQRVPTSKVDINYNGIPDEIEILMWKYAAQVMNRLFFFISLIYAAALYIWYFSSMAYIKNSI